MAVWFIIYNVFTTIVGISGKLQPEVPHKPNYVASFNQGRNYGHVTSMTDATFIRDW